MVGAFLAFQGELAARSPCRDIWPRPALVPQTTLKPTETPEPTEWTERTEQRNQENPSTRTTPHFFELKRSRTENPEFD